MDQIQLNQDEEYNFPYHYVSCFRKNFSQCFNDPWGINYVATIEYLIEKIKKYSFNSLLDIGCGEGRLTKELEFEFPEKNISGVDYSRRAIRLARSLHESGTYYHIDITKDFNRSFDIALLIEVLEHLKPETIPVFIESVAKLLNKKGQLLITVPHVNKKTEYKHYQHFTSTSLVQLLEPLFDIEEIVTFDNIGYQKVLLDSILTNRIFILNNRKIKNWLYEYYKKNLFFTKNEKRCGRLFVKASPKKQ